MLSSDSQRKERSSLDSPSALLLLGGKHEIRKNMKHEELKKLALTREQIDKVMSLHGAYVEAMKTKTGELGKTNKSLQSQIAGQYKNV